MSAAAVALLVSGLFVPAAPAASCGTVGAPGYHAFYVKTKGVSCRTARRLLKSWLEHDARPSGGPRGWRCRKSFSSPWRCTRNGDSISFIFHRY